MNIRKHDRLGIKPEHFYHLEGLNTKYVLKLLFGTGFYRSHKNKGSSVSQPIRLLFTGSIILIKNHLSKFDPEGYSTCTWDSFLYFEFRCSYLYFYLLNQQRPEKPSRFNCEISSCAIGPTSFFII